MKTEPANNKKKTSKNSLSSFTFFYRYLFSKRANSVIRRVSFVCFLGLMVSIGSLLIVFNVMGGLGQSIKDRFLATEPHIIISLEEHSSADFIQEQKKKINNILHSANLDLGVSDFYFFESVDMVLRTPEGSFSGAVAIGYDPIYLKKFLQKIHPEIENSDSVGNVDQEILEKQSLQVEVVRSGEEELFFVNKIKKNKKTIIMGLGLASELDLYDQEKVHLIPAENLLLPPGEPIQFETVQVQSIVSTPNTLWNSSYIFYDRTFFPSFQENSSYRSGFEMRLKEPEDFLLYTSVLEKEGFSVESWPERNSSVFFALKVEKTIMSLFLSLSGLITLLAVSSLLVLLMVQKKKEMGILMAMGLPIKKIQSLFVGIGLFLCSFGIIGAWLFSLSICLFLKYSNIPFLSQFNAGAQFPVEFNILFMLLLFAGIFCLACIGCLLSVRSQTRHSPAELLKTING